MYEENILKLFKLKDLFNKHSKYHVEMKFNSVSYFDAEITIMESQHLNNFDCFKINYSGTYMVDSFIKKVTQKYFTLKTETIDPLIFTDDLGNINI